MNNNESSVFSMKYWRILKLISSKRVEQKLLESNELLQSITHSISTPENHSYDEYALEELTSKITKGSSQNGKESHN